MTSPQPRNWPVIGGGALLAVAAVVLLVAAVIYLTPGTTALEEAAETCASNGQPDIGDDGETLTVTSANKRSAGIASEVSACVLGALDAPASVRSKVAGTTAMMGRQTDSWGDYEMTWTYHPDNGLEIIVESGG